MATVKWRSSAHVHIVQHYIYFILLLYYYYCAYMTIERLTILDKRCSAERNNNVDTLTHQIAGIRSLHSYNTLLHIWHDHMHTYMYEYEYVYVYIYIPRIYKFLLFIPITCVYMWISVSTRLAIWARAFLYMCYMYYIHVKKLNNYLKIVWVLLKYKISHTSYIIYVHVW